MLSKLLILNLRDEVSVDVEICCLVEHMAFTRIAKEMRGGSLPHFKTASKSSSTQHTYLFLLDQSLDNMSLYLEVLRKMYLDS